MKKILKAALYFWRGYSFKEECEGVFYYYWQEKNITLPSKIIKILAIIQFPQSLYYAIKAQICKHPHMVDDSYGGPEGGCMSGHCPDCGFSYHETLY